MSDDATTGELTMTELAPGIYHSADCRTWVFHGDNWLFSGKQGKALRLMVATFHRYGKCAWTDEEILEVVFREEGWEGRTLQRLFRVNEGGKTVQHPCWKRLIGPSTTRGIVVLLVGSGVEMALK